eukprot:g4917.t1
MSSRFERCLNINVGVLGHVDCGKTSLVEKLSTTFSTASLDKHPQSQERGITLDLGFSAFQVPYPIDLVNPGNHYALQFTLVDCPGHASLIKTVLGGSHIMDVAILVVDVTKGIQVQTAECIVMAEITVQKLVVLLNKIDLIPVEKLEKTVRKATRKVTQTLKLTAFKDCEILPVSTKTGHGMEAVVHELTGMITELPERKTGSLLFAIDHCFRIKGQGTVLTGTVLQGKLSIHDVIEFPSLKEKRKVKSIQMFREPIETISAGDRAGICVSNLDPKRIERSLAATPDSVHTSKAALAVVEQVRFFDGFVKSRQKFHILYGHFMTLASCMFLQEGSGDEYEFQEELTVNSDQPQLTLLKFDTPLTAPMDLAMIGAKLDGGSDVLSCRLAFHGKITQFLPENQVAKLKIYRMKVKTGWIRTLNEDQKTAICYGMFKQETDLSFYKGKEILLKNGHKGRITGSHGKSGDFVVSFNHPITLKSEDEKEVTLFIKKYIS